MMEQATTPKGPISVNSISELVEQHKPNTGEIFALSGVLIQNPEDSKWFLSDGAGSLRCFGSSIEFWTNPDLTQRYNVAGTYHGDYFSVYQISLIN